MIKIASIQTNIIWENPKANKLEYNKLFQSLDTADLIILPEMFTTGFSMRAENIAENNSGETLFWLQEHSKSLDACILGSLPIKENNKFFNRLYVIKPNKIQYYDKRYLFSMAQEDKYYSKGEKELVFELKGWKIKPLICYDLRFPLWSKNKYKNNEFDYDILVYVANWPAVRSNAWTSLLKARAIENISYVVGVNRIGKDANEIKYNGSSRVYDFKGKRMDNFKNNIPSIQINNLVKSELISFRNKFPVLKDADDFNFLI
ncbi:amidohydrolase [Flavobacteriales bacterium]|jgi:predicted amidohydrolase|nr:amidohydrolase [Flavobacteriales bacterium]|tara:strand:- start:403 stop:1185 length:783 start_codon:yes stop_codon:yes gene_type:complete